MSNVLIGIIGVILFIGLALAGALFLGPRFQESSNNSKAAAGIQAVSQVSSAANMYNVQEGRTAQTYVVSDPSPGVQILVDRGYLKSLPTAGVSGAGAPRFTDKSGNEPSGGVAAEYTIVDLGSASYKAICTAAARQSGQTLNADGTPPVATTTLPDGPSGCVQANPAANLGGIYKGEYVLFAKI